MGSGAPYEVLPGRRALGETHSPPERAAFGWSGCWSRGFWPWSQCPCCSAPTPVRGSARSELGSRERLLREAGQCRARRCCSHVSGGSSARGPGEWWRWGSAGTARGLWAGDVASREQRFPPSLRPFWVFVRLGNVGSVS